MYYSLHRLNTQGCLCYCVTFACIKLFFVNLPAFCCGYFEVFMAFLSRSILALSVALLSNNVFAQKQCDVELRHGLIITDDIIRIVDKGQTRVQINNNNQLFIRGYWIDLSDDESKVLEQFSSGIRQTVPELVNLATDGVNLGLSAIEHVVEGMTDKESEVLKTQLQYVERALMDKFKRGDDFSLLRRNHFPK